MEDRLAREKVEAILRQNLDPGLYRFGFAELSGLLHPMYSGYQSGLCLIRRLDNAIIDALGHGPTPEYMALYHSVNAELNALLAKLSAFFTAEGIESLAVEATVSESQLDSDYRIRLRHSLSHKMLGTRSGLGWIGKSDLFVSRCFGPRLRMASILFTGNLAQGAKPTTESECGSCRVCVDACPVKAPSGQAWRAGVDRDEFFDAFKCQDHCRAISLKNLGQHISICGICVWACPRGRVHPQKSSLHNPK